MRRIVSAAREHWLALTVVAVVCVLVVVVPGLDWRLSLGILSLTAGAAAAVIGPSHALRNGLVGALLVLVVLIGAGVVQVLQGTYTYPAGESSMSFWIELPIWAILLGVPMALLGVVGGAAALLVRPALRPRPR